MNALETIIVRRLITDMAAQGYQVAAVWDSVEYILANADGKVCGLDPEDVRTPLYTNIIRPLTADEAIAAISAVDAIVTLHFTRHNKTTWGNRGVMLVQGNGEDIISDHHCADGEPFESVIDGIYSKIEERAL